MSSDFEIEISENLNFELNFFFSSPSKIFSMNPMTSFNICTQFPEHSTHQTDYKQGNVNFFVIFEKMSSEFELEISEKYEF